MRKLWSTAAAIPLMCVMCLAGAPAAQAAAVTNVCGNGGSGYCLNAWNGGPYVRMYYGHSSNENFEVEGVDTCMGSGAVMSTRAGDPINCPFSDPNLDYNLRGAPTVGIVYFLPSGTGIKCVGTGNLNGQRDVGYLGSCGDPYGNGIIQGGIDVVDFGNLSCDGLQQTVLINNYWTNYNEQRSYVTSGGNSGTPVYVGAIGSGTCWGGSGGY